VSQENVEIVERAVDSYNRRDIDAMRMFIDPDVELDWSASRGFVAGVYRGFDEFLRFWREYFDVFEEIAMKPDDFMDAGDSVIVPNVVHMRGRDGIEVSAQSAVVYTVRNRRVTRICLYHEMQEALKAVRLEE
jgi:ketosteroid isomerase-like protein